MEEEKHPSRVGFGERALLFMFGYFVASRIFGWQIALLGLIVGIGVQVYLWHRATTLWTRLGVPCAPALPLLGHAHKLMGKGFHYCDMEWTKKYGKLYGSYLFTQPEIVISDEELLKKVLVKDFHNFTNRRTFVMSKKSLFNRMVSAMKDDDWKSTRSAITPAFTSGKLKSTFHLVEHCVKTMCTILEEQGDAADGVDVKTIMGNMTMDVIAAAAFALDVDAQRNPNNEFTRHAKILGSLTFKDWRIMLTIFFPWTVMKLDEQFGIRVFMPGMEEFYEDNLTKVINERRREPKTQNLDFLQLLINSADNANSAKKDTDAGEIDTVIDHSQSTTTNGHQTDQSINKNWRLTDRDIVAQSFLFLFAGHETTATTLTFASYLLALNPDKQEKAYEEVRGLIGNNGAITYEQLQKDMPYLDAVLSETLRIFPPATRFDRMCLDDYQLTDDLVIPKDCVVCVPVYAIHHNPENYEEPEKFEPERFLEKDKKQMNPFIYLPFGYGPRNCIGMRFAQLEAKLALTNVLKQFRIEKCAQTTAYPPELDVQGLLHTKKPIQLAFKKRQN